MPCIRTIWLPLTLLHINKNAQSFWTWEVNVFFFRKRSHVECFARAELNVQCFSFNVACVDVLLENLYNFQPIFSRQQIFIKWLLISMCISLCWILSWKLFNNYKASFKSIHSRWTWEWMFLVDWLNFRIF